MALIGLITLMGCRSSSDDPTPEPVAQEPLEEVYVPISFNGSESETKEAVTRAGTPLSQTGIEAFKVWGYKNMGSYDSRQTVFPGFVVNWQENSAATTTTNSSGWEYVGKGPDPTTQTIKYWDWSAMAYRFFGMTGGAEAYVAHEPIEADDPYTFDIPADASPEVDGEGIIDLSATETKMAATPYFTHLWFSTGNPATYPTQQFGKPVQLEFLKPYVRVRYIFNYAYPREGIRLENKHFYPTDNSKIVRKGTVTISYPLTGSETRESFTITPNSSPDTDVSKALTDFDEDCDPEDDSKVYTKTINGWYTVLPNNTQGSYKLTVTVNGDPKSCTVPAQYMLWQPGYSYTYVFKITDEGGVEIGWVESAVTPWTEMSADWTVYNW